MNNEDHKAAKDHVKLEYAYHDRKVTLRDVIDSFNALTPAARSFLSQAGWEAKKDWLNKVRA